MAELGLFDQLLRFLSRNTTPEAQGDPFTFEAGAMNVGSGQPSLGWLERKKKRSPLEELLLQELMRSEIERFGTRQ